MEKRLEPGQRVFWGTCPGNGPFQSPDYRPFQSPG